MNSIPISKTTYTTGTDDTIVPADREESYPMTIRESLEELVHQALVHAVEAGDLALTQIPLPSLERPREESHGDWACTIAMRLAKIAHENPRKIAECIVDHLPQNAIIASTSIAGPGFINFVIAAESFQEVVEEVRREGSSFGKGVLDESCKVNLEYVSANPTGPMHVGHGRWAALGDSMARVMRHELRKRGIKKLKVVYSQEKPIRPIEDMSISCRTHCICPPGAAHKCTERRDIPGSTAFVPSVVGLIIAGEVIKDLSGVGGRA